MDAGIVMRVLQQLDADLAMRQNDAEKAAKEWVDKKAEREKAYARALIAAEGTQEARKAQATIQSRHIGLEEEAAWEGHRAVMNVLDKRASVNQSLLKGMGRG